MDSSRLLRITLFGEVDAGRKHQGRQKLHYQDQLKRSLNQSSFNPKSLEQLATDRATWGKQTSDGVESFERTKKNRMKIDGNENKKNRINHVPFHQYHVTAAHASSITSYAFKATFAIET